jgi:hypothetical protein
LDQFVHKCLVCGEEQLEWGAIQQLTREVPRRSKDQFDPLVGLFRKVPRDRLKRKSQVRCGGNGWRTLRGSTTGTAEHNCRDNHPGPTVPGSLHDAKSYHIVLLYDSYRS